MLNNNNIYGYVCLLKKIHNVYKSIVDDIDKNDIKLIPLIEESESKYYS
jgi:hypothetical protein